MPRLVDPSAESIDHVAAVLRQGGVAAFPTETVYGLGADTFNPRAIEAVYRLKQRPTDNPLIAHVCDVADAMRITKEWNESCAKLASRFWPGPLTLVLHKADHVPEPATASLPTIAVRCPAHPVALELLKVFGGPISAPSANRSGHVSPTSARHVADDFANVDDLLVLDGGPCRVGLESTVVDMTLPTPRVLRPGAVTLEQLREALGHVDDPRLMSQSSSPGTAERHYAPRTRTILIDADDLDETLTQLHDPAIVLGKGAMTIAAPHRSLTMPSDVNEYAASLYDSLRQADHAGMSIIVIVKPPETTGLWRAIHDRLRRAAAGSQE